ncbi:hypothetical protein [Halalkalicoccus salilacus]|uniref:hypothetical protein n=1 Tax=Halalkalicoccus salilacus TaxID=3117459 RepID=UPI00300EF102
MTTYAPLMAWTAWLEQASIVVEVAPIFAPSSASISPSDGFSLSESVERGTFTPRF